MNSEQIKLCNELYAREGTDAVIRYLHEHEGMEVERARSFAVTLGFPDGSHRVPLRAIFEHYCMFDDILFLGKEGALCPHCGTDGYEDTRTVLVKTKQYIRGILGLRYETKVNI